MKKSFVPGIAALLICLGCAPGSFPQNSQGAGKAQTAPPESPAGLLIAEAEAAGAQEGNQEYAKHLTEMFVTSRTGDAYIDAFSSRLSTADLMARRGKRGLIPESVVAQAFNDLMKETGGSYQTDANIVHQLRITLSEVSPALSTVTSHDSECLPSEAVEIMVQLLSHDGVLRGPCPPMKPGVPERNARGCAEGPDADALVFAYMSSHPRSRRQAVYERVAQLFGF